MVMSVDYSKGSAVLSASSRRDALGLAFRYTLHTLQRNERVTICIRGRSMRPTLAEGDQVTITPVPMATVSVGQMVAYRICDEHITIHRVVEVIDGNSAQGPTFRTKGDSNPYVDPYAIGRREFLGVATRGTPE